MHESTDSARCCHSCTGDTYQEPEVSAREENPYISDASADSGWAPDSEDGVSSGNEILPSEGDGENAGHPEEVPPSFPRPSEESTYLWPQGLECGFQPRLSCLWSQALNALRSGLPTLKPNFMDADSREPWSNAAKVFKESSHAQRHGQIEAEQESSGECLRQQFQYTQVKIFARRVAKNTEEHRRTQKNTTRRDTFTQSLAIV
ncbi:unnamed protein product [Phytophthora fragariaefolia]|uniref:Unnamed protein product n=1 Tax=Phytophthora fragariaefolia TaxID=1490495 RepID=A0A9W7CWJ8_9STRA|nr:unnamed protein product [Phytophthora fragariaefolia]